MFIKSILTHDIVVRAIKTFVQAFLAALAAGVTNVASVATAEGLLLAAGAAGVSAAWNLVLSARNR
jgi:hypothetical protein